MHTETQISPIVEAHSVGVQVTLVVSSAQEEQEVQVTEPTDRNKARIIRLMKKRKVNSKPK